MSMMTDDEMARADAEYEALPGTPPDGWSFLPGRPTREEITATLSKWTDMTFCRVTDVDDPGVWIEVWKVEPYKQAAFNPPYTLAEG